MKRTHTCGALTSADAGKTVVLNGWVHRHRDHGEIMFLNLRDRYGITQVVFDSSAPAEARETVKGVKFEYCVAVRGTVRTRPETMRNPDMKTGDIEVVADSIQILSKCETLPFMIDDDKDVKEDLRLRYRYLDLRSSAMQEALRLRHQVAFSVRNYLVGKGFYEIETPTFIRSTPEGARDYLVPSRIHAGKFYALPQSPQLFKQLLMVSGFDKYFQIARCYRDEDARGDRQPEFTQIDLEMSFTDPEEVYAVTEGMMKAAFKEALGLDLPTPFPRLGYHEAMNLYGSDKPDLRFGMEMGDFGPFVEGSGFEAFQSVLATGGTVKCLVAKGCAGYSRKQIGELEDAAKVYKAKGLAWMKVTESGLEGGVSKFFAPRTKDILEATGAESGDLILMVADAWRIACASLGAVRIKLGADLKLPCTDRTKAEAFKFAWIVDFPMFEWNEDEKKWDAAHHVFTMPQAKYLATLESDPGAVKGDLYDLVCNGYELASGSMRIHDIDLQKRVLAVIGIPEAEAQKRFGFLLDAFRYGPPPHGGIAPGLDRLVMLMAGKTTIREVIAFPKNTVGVSPMDECPAEVDAHQLEELHLSVLMPKPEG